VLPGDPGKTTPAPVRWRNSSRVRSLLKNSLNSSVRDPAECLFLHYRRCRQEAKGRHWVSGEAIRVGAGSGSNGADLDKIM
jgi:hypothetical protein